MAEVEKKHFSVVILSSTQTMRHYFREIPTILPSVTKKNMLEHPRHQ